MAVVQSDSESGRLNGYVGRIPVRNLWLLILYASDLFRTIGNDKFEKVDNPDELPDLIGEFLADAVEKRQRRQLSFGYQTRNAVLNRVRGRIDVLTTERHQLLERARIACRFDDLTIDTPRNRFVRAALETIARLVQPKLAHRCRTLANGMKAMGVSGKAPTRAEISKERLGRHDADDQIMLSAAKLVFDLALPTETSGNNLMAMPDREERWVRRLFERAIGGFYEVVLRPQGWSVQRGTTLSWQIEDKSSGIDNILPSMRTDIILDYPSSLRRIVIDTKFNAIVTKGWYREETLRSGYLYQIYAYLMSQVGRGNVLADNASGLLLHPSIGEAVDQTVTIQGHKIRFATVNLAGSATEFREQLLNLCETY